MSEFFYLVEGDTSPGLERVLRDHAGQPINLAGASVTFSMGNRVTGAAKITAAPALIQSAAAGVVRYGWTPEDTDTAGQYDAEFTVTYADGAIESFPRPGKIRVSIEAKSGQV